MQVHQPPRLTTEPGTLIAHALLGYWHHAGVSVSKSCEQAAWHYEHVADAVMAHFKAGPYGGAQVPRFRVPLAKGVYGRDASGSGNPAKQVRAVKESDVLMMYKLQAEGGDAAAQVLFIFHVVVHGINYF